MVITFASIPGKAAITFDILQAFVRPLTKLTVNSRELIGLKMTLKIFEDHLEAEKLIAIFTNNQASIAVVKTPKL